MGRATIPAGQILRAIGSDSPHKSGVQGVAGAECKASPVTVEDVTRLMRCVSLQVATLAHEPSSRMGPRVTGA
ncbi:hypothetical protein E2C01_101586 [Portunus trituberculatus]|uniref:Uncharacterized protein n=1 Tax=Portunus trituberculatus TaxID=210409 RepID=A0A5B7KKH7_PORTR|nr:hypothetical protein [Portunus trituberculatus]